MKQTILYEGKIRKIMIIDFFLKLALSYIKSATSEKLGSQT